MTAMQKLAVPLRSVARGGNATEFQRLRRGLSHIHGGHRSMCTGQLDWVVADLKRLQKETMQQRGTQTQWMEHVQSSSERNLSRAPGLSEARCDPAMAKRGYRYSAARASTDSAAAKASQSQSFEAGSTAFESFIDAWQREVSSTSKSAASEASSRGKVRPGRSSSSLQRATPPPTFIPSGEWQLVPEDAICPAGLQFKFDLSTGTKLARIPPQEAE
mmetsp:Transcript_35727/g.83650  ORF Transcript_35727/g.83650 Transcript_35727/m.83650 type:complete len:217 (-) Transcript_35727:164-814(-)|eukprot:CAMPEP_0178436914 /NCGR_PEP_ID=MMETSP0689_2-20121128/34692_1 /TAXON_ID=160604 /ORGANISM="Amphidinium massartii, Strain CS-259" /LENGTH=216 /DNA_ID=CAMNT_0020059039 /DNA_START=49 /DNA_END=699 /DNA_ORIENTATION=+